MIYRVAIENFYSVRDRIEVSLIISAKARDDDFQERYARLIPNSKDRVPKVVGLWGANASGKSTVLRALSFVSSFVQHSFFSKPETEIECTFHNTERCRNSPMEISVEFNAPVDLLALPSARHREHCLYTYTLIMSGQNRSIRPSRVERESLYCRRAGSRKKTKVFDRKLKEITAAKEFDLRPYEQSLRTILRDNVSLISTLVQMEHEPSRALLQFARNIVPNISAEKHEFDEGVMARYYSENPNILADLNRDIKKIDLGIEEVRVEAIQSQTASGTNTQYRSMFTHSGLFSPLPATMESHGTRQFFRIFPFIKIALSTGGVAVIDELDTAIHPLLLPEILRWFYDRDRNPLNAQLWFTCQNPALLQEMSKDEVLFCEKDSEGGTEVFALKNIRSVRRADNYMKKYIGGSFGAIPRIG